MGITKGFVAPHLSTPSPLTPGSAGLPDDILSEQARRIVLFSGVAAFMWCFGLTMDGFVLPATIGFQPARASLIIEALAAVVTFAVFLFMRIVHLHTHAKCRAGVWVMLLNALFITLFEITNVGMAAGGIGRPSWIAILILTAAMIMPGAPR